MTPLARFVKDPNEVLPYSIDWTAWIPDGETLSSVAWEVVGENDDALTIDGDALAGNVATVVVSLGTLAQSYELKCTATTTPSSYQPVRTLVITIERR
jgi:hypothetical protein